MQQLFYDRDSVGPLNGVRVLDMSRLIAGNVLSAQLGDFGAEVIKVEMLPNGDPLRAWKSNGISTYWKAYCRNKKSLALNMRDPKGLSIIKQLATTCDVFIENMIPGRLENMGIGPMVLHQDNPGLVIVRISGFGQTGPYSSRPGFGTVIEAMSGFAAKNGYAGEAPLVPPMALADMLAGLSGAMATLAALRFRDANGTGQVIDLSLLEPLVAAIGADAADYAVTGSIKPRLGNASNTSSPRNLYLTKDGRWVAISASIQSMAERVFRVIGQPMLINDPRFSTNSSRVAHRDEVDALVGNWVKRHTQEVALQVLQDAGVTAGPVYDTADFVENSHVKQRAVIVELPDEEMGFVPMHNISPRLSETPGSFRYPAPHLGQDNEAILSNLGYTTHQIQQMSREGVTSQ